MAEKTLEKEEEKGKGGKLPANGEPSGNGAPLSNGEPSGNGESSSDGAVTRQPSAEAPKPEASKDPKSEYGPGILEALRKFWETRIKKKKPAVKAAAAVKPAGAKKPPVAEKSAKPAAKPPAEEKPPAGEKPAKPEEIDQVYNQILMEMLGSTQSGGHTNGKD